MQRMVNNVGTSQDSREFRSQLEQLQQYTQQLAKDTSSALRIVSNTTNTNTPEYRQWKAQRDRLADEFTTALNSFQNAQRSAAQHAREQVQRSRANYDPFARPHEELVDVTNTNTKQKQLQDEVDLELLEEQERSVRRLEQDIGDVNQIFKELGTLVHDQGEMVDSIEASVERSHVFVQEGAQQLRTAHSYSSRLRKRKFILAMLAAVILAIVIGIIAWQCS